MMELIRRPLLVVMLVSSCGTTSHVPLTAADHERKARSYEATADSIEDECWKSRRNELTVDSKTWCWKGEDIRFLEANRDAAATHRAAAAELRGQTARR